MSQILLIEDSVMVKNNHETQPHQLFCKIGKSKHYFRGAEVNFMFLDETVACEAIGIKLIEKLECIYIFVFV